MAKEIIDISLPISPALVVWPGAPKTEIILRRSMARGDRNNNSNFLMSCHTGTHVDAPLHFFQGKESVDRISLETMIGEVFVLDISGRNEIAVEDFEKVWPKEGVQRVLIKTSNSKLWQEKPHTFVENYVALTELPARWLLNEGVQLIGIDYLSIQRFGDLPTVHQILLEKNVVILEGLDLTSVLPGFYELICLPLKLLGTEGAPARVVLRRR